MGELGRAADALLRPELAHGALAAAVAALAGLRWWRPRAGPVAVVVGLAWVAAVVAPVEVAALVGLAVAAVVASVPVGAWTAHRLGAAAAAVGVIAAFGVFAVVPDTERALALLGAVVVSAVAVRRVDRRWLATVAVAAAWVAVVDGAPRGSAVAGALGCAAVPALLAAVPRRVPTSRGRSWLAVAVALAGSAVCARVAGLRSSTPEAVAIVAVVVAAELAALVLASRRRDPATSPASVTKPGPVR